MVAIAQILTLLVLYSAIFAVPSALANKRRRLDLPIYWWLLLLAFALELVVLYGVVGLLSGLLKGGKIAWLPFYSAPLVACVVAGLFYHHLSKQLDNKRNK